MIDIQIISLEYLDKKLELKILQVPYSVKKKNLLLLTPLQPLIAMKGAGLSPPKEINNISGNVSANSSDNETEPKGLQVDTATLQNTSTSFSYQTPSEKTLTTPPFDPEDVGVTLPTNDVSNSKDNI